MSSKRQPETLIFYLDRNLGNYIVAKKLREFGLNVEIHDDHLPKDAADETWIELISKKNWVGITKDKKIRFRAAEISSVKKHKARLFVIRSKNARAIDNAETIIKAYARIVQFVKKIKPPFVAGINSSGKITNYKLK